MSRYVTGVEYTDEQKNGARKELDSDLTKIARGYGGKRTYVDNFIGDIHFIFDNAITNSLNFSQEASAKKGVVVAKIELI